MSKRQFVEVSVYDFGDFSSFSDSLDMEFVESVIKEVKEDYGAKYENFALRIKGSNYDEECISLSLVGRRLESDKEFDNRMKKEKERKEKLLEQKKREYENLKAELGEK